MGEKWTHVLLGQTVIGPQFQNFTLKYCFLTWRRASENFDCPKMGNLKKQNILGACARGNVFFARSKTVLPSLEEV